MTGSGYRKLVNHVERTHPDEFSTATGSTNRTSSETSPTIRPAALSQIVWKPNSLKMYEQLPFIVFELKPFIICANPIAKKPIKHESI